MQIANFEGLKRHSGIQGNIQLKEKLNIHSIYTQIVSCHAIPKTTVLPYVMLCRMITLFKQDKTCATLYARNGSFISDEIQSKEKMTFDFIMSSHFVDDNFKQSFLDFCLSNIYKAESLGSHMFYDLNTADKICRTLKVLNKSARFYYDKRPYFEKSFLDSVSCTYPMYNHRKAVLFSKRLFVLFNVFEMKPNFIADRKNDYLKNSLNESWDEEKKFFEGESKFLEKLNENMNKIFWNSTESELKQICYYIAKLLQQP